MTLDELKDIDVSNLPTMDEKSRQEVIMLGKKVYLDGVKDAAELLEIDFIDLLKSSVYHSEDEIEKFIKDEKYEMCYFLTGIINEIKKEYKEI